MEGREKKGAITAEAALVLPMFLFAVLFFLYFFQLLYLQDSIQGGITEAGKALSRCQPVTELAQEPEKELTDVAKQVFLKQRFYEYLDEETINESCIAGGRYGINLDMSKLSETEAEDDIEITALYQIQFPIPFFGNQTSLVLQRVHTRAFVGKEMKKLSRKENTAEEAEDCIVYITENGMVYHKNENCSHLRLTITEIAAEQLGDARNENGGKYKPCEKCTENASPESIVYITREGDRYHNCLSCSGLKRTVYAVRYSEVKDRIRCSRCGGD